MSSPQPRRPAVLFARARGYTVVEVLLAMTVLIIGASGVMSMQKAAILGNLDARKTDVAANIGRMWMERIQKDAMSWTLPSPSYGGPSNFGNAPLLGYVGTGWVVPISASYLPAASGTAPISPGFDVLGRDIPSVAGLSAAVFCVHLRETWLANNVNNVSDSLMRVEIRVVWPRGFAYGKAPPLCSAGSTVTPPDPQLYSTLYMVTAVRANGIQ